MRLKLPDISVLCDRNVKQHQRHTNKPWVDQEGKGADRDLVNTMSWSFRVIISGETQYHWTSRLGSFLCYKLGQECILIIIFSRTQMSA